MWSVQADGICASLFTPALGTAGSNPGPEVNSSFSSNQATTTIPIIFSVHLCTSHDTVK
jgi:hypothetical protein